MLDERRKTRDERRKTRDERRETRDERIIAALFSIFLISQLVACAGTTQTAEATKQAPEISVAKDSAVLNNASEPQNPAKYQDIQYPEFKYVVPRPETYRVVISDSITGYIVEDKSLPLASLSVMFREYTVPKSAEEIAAKEILSGMFKNGGSKVMSAQAIDDSLEFISAGIGGGVGTRSSHFSVNSLSRDFYSTANMARDIFTKPAFDSARLEIQKANFVTAYERRFDTPAAVLGALKAKVNYQSSPRLWDANAEEYKKVSVADLQKFAPGKFTPNRIVFSFAGDLPRDSVIAFLTDYFKNWNVETAKTLDTAETTILLNKPGIYGVDREVTQANIALNQPFIKRPHPDYYKAVVASFILGGGSFSSRLMEQVRSNNGLAYSIYSTVGNSYNDTALTTIALQTKIESAKQALDLIKQEIEKLAAEGPTEAELALAKKTLIESLPSMFSTAEETAGTFADNEFVGKKMDHFDEYVREINAVTAEDVKAMTAKYFDYSKMTISVVAPKAVLESLGNVTIIPLDSLEMRP